MEIIFILISKFITQLLTWKLHCLPTLKQLLRCHYCRPLFLCILLTDLMWVMYMKRHM